MAQATWVCVATILLYISRAVYDLIAIAIPRTIPAFGYDWINVSDEVSETVPDFLRLKHQNGLFSG